MEVYKQLRTLQHETNPSAFIIMIAKFYENLTSDSDTTDFANYFQMYYMKNCEQWAYCHRLHSGLNTNRHLERMHHTIKYIYIKGKRVKRLDKAIDLIMKFVRDKFFDRSIMLHKGKITNKLKEIQRRHKTSMDLDMSLIVKNGDGWDMPSSSKSSHEIYHIEELKMHCDCQLICSECKICLHRYYCSCIDSSIRWNMCKHIHLLCKFRQNEVNKYPASTSGKHNISYSIKRSINTS